MNTPTQTQPAALKVTESQIARFASRLQGKIIRPGDSEYDQARAVWNGMIDRHPALIVRCQTVADVIAAVDFAREHDARVSVRGGGHNAAGSAVNDGGLVIDLSQMKNVYVNPQLRTARAEGGVIWGELDRATQAHGLATPGGVVSDTGIAGLTLGGGYGWLRNKYGLSSDNLISAQVVTSDSRLLTASESENPDLLWGLRGGGGSLGIVTSFEYRLHPLGPEVMMCFCFHDGSNAGDILRFLREYAANAPDEISPFAALGRIPESEHFPKETHGKPFVLVVACYAGDAVEGQKLIQPLREIGKPIMDLSGVMPWVQAQTLFDEDYPSGELRYYWKSTYLNSFSDEVIDHLVRLTNEAPSPLSTLDIWSLGGAIRRVPVEATAFPHRSAPILIGIESNWADTKDDDANIAWARRVADELRPFAAGQYLNFPGFHEGGDAMFRDAFGPNYTRMQQVKAKYDPINLFRIG